jgi:hypothetical protein
MPTQSKQQAAIQAANDLQALMQRARDLRRDFKDFNDRYSSEQYATTWAAMPTAPQNADGSISNTPDGAPNPANPIIVGGIYRSKNALVAGVAFVQQYVALVSNQALTQGNWSQNIDDVAS